MTGKHSCRDVSEIISEPAEADRRPDRKVVVRRMTAGRANGGNPVFWIAPCHRVVRSDGGSDRYFWGEEVKKRLLAWEFACSEDRARTGF